ncbi:MAG: alkaline phosphatase family protein [Clostridia bacterium]|nr:alkaline phosphatase family protein [Clostridia bacterium]
MLKKTVSILLSALILFSCFSLAASAKENKPYGFGDYDHVFIIGVDGAGAAFSQTETPCFDSIFADGAVRHNCATERITISAQNWGSILLGVPCDTHGLTNDICKYDERNTKDDSLGSIFRYTREQYPDAELVSFNNWSAINKGIIENDIGVKKINKDYDSLLTDTIVDYINAGNEPTLMFVQLDDVDHAAHTYGGFSDNYYQAIRTADGYIGRIYNALAENGLMENGLFIVVSDHGETNDGHGGNTVEESTAVVAVKGKSVNNMTLPEGTRNRDVAAIALHALGIEKPVHMFATVPYGLFGEEKGTDLSPAEPEENEDVCGYCGVIHSGFFDVIRGFFHKIALFFTQLFR